MYLILNYQLANVKVPRNFNLYHFSWTYLLTLGQLLLFKNENIIEDADQIEIMRESLHYFESKVSCVSGYTKMMLVGKNYVTTLELK